MKYSNFRLPLLFASASALAAQTTPSAPDLVLQPLVVTSPATSDKPLVTTLSTVSPAQPIPAQDGADVLKSVPGFSVSRKGGADGEAIFRGQAGSRLNLLLDGESALGGCPHRMDPPTAYIFPQAYDRVTILKGPQTVLYGAGNSSGVVLFERDIHRLDTAGLTADGAMTAASFARFDASAKIRAGTPDYYVEASANRSKSGDYNDGDGRAVHSHYERSSVKAATGWTPDANTLVEVSATKSEGEAAYGYSMMDATKLDRDNLSVRFRKQNISPLVANIEGLVYYNYIDHVMDDYSLRTFKPSMMGPNPSASNPDHRLFGGRAEADLKTSDATLAKVGIDFLDGRHRSRSTGNQTGMPYQSLARKADASISDVGLFGELTGKLNARDRLIGGFRVDGWRACDERDSIAGMMSSAPNPTAHKTRSETNPSGFLRYESDLEKIPATAYVGIGYTERAPDYWELITNESLTTKSSFLTKGEKTTQIDTGVNYKKGPLTASVSLFYNEVANYILVQNNVAKGGMGMGMGGMSKVTVTRNISASSYGGEAALNYSLNAHWKLDASLAYVRGNNNTDHVPLAQQPPLEGRLGFAYVSHSWSVGGLARFVAAQDRFAVDQGTIIGQDLGRTSGFSVFSVNAGWKITTNALLSAGVDNLLDQTYAEHLSRNGGAVSGYPITTRVNEPGRTLWLKLSVNY